VRHALPCALIFSAIACAETRASEDLSDRSEQETNATPATEPARADEVAPMEDEPAFDFRRMRTEPEAHRGKPRVCRVGFADEAQALEPRERDLFPEDVAMHRTVRCDTTRGGGWIEVIFDGDDDVDEVSAGRRVVVVPEMESGGRHGYVIARYARSLGAASDEIEGEAPPPGSGADGFDFGRLSEGPQPEGSRRVCIADFISEIHLLDEERRQRLGYPEGVSNRLDVKCLHASGDSWIDLVFEEDDAERALEVAEGEALDVEVISVAGGYAGRPIVRLGEP
jgi:hypothetical protein